MGRFEGILVNQSHRGVEGRGLRQGFPSTALLRANSGRSAAGQMLVINFIYMGIGIKSGVMLPQEGKTILFLMDNVQYDYLYKE
jgi:hypothetical protein